MTLIDQYTQSGFNSRKHEDTLNIDLTKAPSLLLTGGRTSSRKNGKYLKFYEKNL